MANREILFRGKSLYTDEGWRYGLLSRRTDISCLLNEQGKSPQHECDPETIGQYTGLTDKNGGRIFEGDVVINQWGDKGVTVFRKGAFQFKHPDSAAYAGAAEWEFPIIIGNIHDNPELLTKPE